MLWALLQLAYGATHGLVVVTDEPWAQENGCRVKQLLEISLPNENVKLISDATPTTSCHTAHGLTELNLLNAIKEIPQGSDVVMHLIMYSGFMVMRLHDKKQNLVHRQTLLETIEKRSFNSLIVYADMEEAYSIFGDVGIVIYPNRAFVSGCPSSICAIGSVPPCNCTTSLFTEAVLGANILSTNTVNDHVLAIQSALDVFLTNTNGANCPGLPASPSIVVAASGGAAEAGRSLLFMNDGRYSSTLHSCSSTLEYDHALLQRGYFAFSDERTEHSMNSINEFYSVVSEFEEAQKAFLMVSKCADAQCMIALGRKDPDPEAVEFCHYKVTKMIAECSGWSKGAMKYSRVIANACMAEGVLPTDFVFDVEAAWAESECSVEELPDNTKVTKIFAVVGLTTCSAFLILGHIFDKKRYIITDVAPT